MLMIQSYVTVIQIYVLVRTVYIQTYVDAVAAWLSSCRLCLNVGKSNCMLIESHQRVANKSLHV